MNKVIYIQNPINRVHESVPPLVWNYFSNILSEKIGEAGISQSEKNSFRQTIIRYATNVPARSNIRTINIILRRIMEAVWPLRPEFFEGSPQDAIAAADETAAKMIEQFETLLETQKAALAS